MALADVGEPWVPSDTFAARLALIRQHLGGWNVKKAADYCGIDDQSWRNWEAGKGHPRDYEHVCRKIAEATGCDRKWLAAGGTLIMTCLIPVENPRDQQLELSFLPRPELTAA